MKNIQMLFFAQYYGQKNLFVSKSAVAIQPNTAAFWNMCYDGCYISLRTISQLTDDEIIQVARLAHQMPNGKFVVIRNDDIIHCQYENNVGITSHISLYKDYGSIGANTHFSATDTEKFTSYKANIGEINMSSKLPLPYVAICDYLRQIGVLIPFNYFDEHGEFVTLHVSDLIKKQWVKITLP